MSKAFDEDAWLEIFNSTYDIYTEPAAAPERTVAPNWFIEELKDGNPGAAGVVSLLAGGVLSVVIFFLIGFGIL